MRIFILSLVLLAGSAALQACSSTGNNAAAINALDNPANSCGPGGTSNIEECDYGRRR